MLADHHRHLGRSEQTVVLHVPSERGQERVATGGQAGRVGDGRAGHEGHCGARRQTEQVDEPPAHDVVDRRRHRRHDRQRGVLVPRGGEPRGAEGDWQRAAGDEPEVASARRCDRAGAAELVEHPQRGGGRLAVLPERLGEAGERVEGAGVREHPPLLDRSGVRQRPRRCVLEHPRLVHRPILPRRQGQVPQNVRYGAVADGDGNAYASKPGRTSKGWVTASTSRS